MGPELVMKIQFVLAECCRQETTIMWGGAFIYQERNAHIKKFWGGMDSARGVAAIAFFSAAVVNKLLQSFCCFECNSLFAVVRVKGRSKHVSSMVAAPSIEVAPLADFTPSCKSNC